MGRWPALIALLVACGGRVEEEGLRKADLELAEMAVYPRQPWSLARDTLLRELSTPWTETSGSLVWVSEEEETCHALVLSRHEDVVESATVEEVVCPRE